ncbi:MAG: hydrogenase maturation nickel metallochaperone HypA [Pirellulales bacterium]|nr:hydrogenase maturation nickel metallochaperone HypA [Pirellulales bacterium]
MHELSLAQNIMEIVEAERAEHGFERVHEIRLKVGALSGIDPQALELAFEAVREDTCAAEATIEIDAEPRVVTCRRCGATMDADPGPVACGSCGSTDLDLQGSTGLDIVSLEVD